MDQNWDGFINKEDLKGTYFSLSKTNVKDDKLDAMHKEASGPINLTMFLSLFGETCIKWLLTSQDDRHQGACTLLHPTSLCRPSMVGGTRVSQRVRQACGALQEGWNCLGNTARTGHPGTTDWRGWPGALGLCTPTYSTPTRLLRSTPLHPLLPCPNTPSPRFPPHSGPAPQRATSSCGPAPTLRSRAPEPPPGTAAVWRLYLGCQIGHTRRPLAGPDRPAACSLQVDQLLAFASMDAAGNLDYKALSYVLANGEE
ncbi:myosin light chain 5 [Erethizon dorsatum]